MRKKKKGRGGCCATCLERDQLSEMGRKKGSLGWGIRKGRRANGLFFYKEKTGPPGEGVRWARPVQGNGRRRMKGLAGLGLALNWAKEKRRMDPQGKEKRKRRGRLGREREKGEGKWTLLLSQFFFFFSQ